LNATLRAPIRVFPPSEIDDFEELSGLLKQRRQIINNDEHE